MIDIEIPGFGEVHIEHLVADFSGTLSLDGILLPGIKERLNRLSEKININILTADTHGKAKKQLEGIDARINFLSDNTPEDDFKENFVRKLGAESVAAVGNGNNDRKMLKAARIGIAVCIGEGCAGDAYRAADILVCRAEDALDLLLYPDRLKATLRF